MAGRSFDLSWMRTALSVATSLVTATIGIISTLNSIGASAEIAVVVWSGIPLRLDRMYIAGISHRHEITKRLLLCRRDAVDRTLRSGGSATGSVVEEQVIFVVTTANHRPVLFSEQARLLENRRNCGRYDLIERARVFLTL